MEHYGELIRSIRMSQGKTIKQVAASTQLGRNTVTKIEQGDIHVGFLSVLKLAKELNVVVTISAPIQTDQKWSTWKV